MAKLHGISVQGRVKMKSLRGWITVLPSAAVISLILAGGGLPAAAGSLSTAKTATAIVANAGEIVIFPNHQLLVTDIGNLDRTGGHVLVTDFSDRLIWEYAGHLDIPHAAYPMPNGDVLIADTGDNRVIEVNRSSQIVWDSDNLGKGHGVLGQGTMSDGRPLLYPNDAKPLANGHILISCRLQNRVIEITRTGQIVREIDGLHGQHNPDLLKNGDVLIADSGADRVVEVNQRGNIVWQFGGESGGADILNWPRDANLLPNGHILITDSANDRLIEVTRSHRIVRRWTNLSRPYSTASLPNGDILVGAPNAGVIQLNRRDHVVWTLNHRSGAEFQRTPWHVLNGSFEHTIPGSKWILKAWHRNDALAYSLPAGQRATMVRDAHVFHKGRYSARITYHGDSNGIYLGQIVRVLPGHRYRFSGWIKTHNVRACYPCVYGPQDPRGHTAEYELGYNSTSGPPAAPPLLPQHVGSSGWVHDNVTFTVPANVTSLGIECNLRGQGTVWFDNVWLQKLS